MRLSKPSRRATRSASPRSLGRCSTWCAQLGADLGLQPQLALVVALLLAAARRERVERAALVVVDPVRGPVLIVAEREHRAQDAVAVAAGLQGGGDGVDA